MFKQTYKNVQNKVIPSDRLVNETKQLMKKEMMNMKNEVKSENELNKETFTIKMKDKEPSRKFTFIKTGIAIAGCLGISFFAITFFSSNNNDTPGSANIMNTPPAFSSTVEPTIQPSVTPTIDPTSTPSVSSVPVDNSLSSPIKVTSGYSERDLNGDGTLEKITFKNNILTINDAKLNLEEAGNYYPETEYFYIVDLKSSDHMLELAFDDMGPSDDRSAFFVQFNNNSIIQLGRISSYVEDMTFYHDGTTSSSQRLSIFQTWWGEMYNGLSTTDNQLHSIEKESYDTSKSFINDPENQVKLLIKLPIYSERNRSLTPTYLKPQKVLFLATDNKNWIQVKGVEDGVTGWFYLDSFSTITDLGKDSSEVFEGLCFAD